MTDEFVKKCNVCKAMLTPQQMVDDPDVRPIGTTFFEDGPDTKHYYFFQHETPGCGTSFVIDVECFLKFIKEPIPEKIMRAQPGCGGHCASIDDLSDCDRECHFAPFRRFLLEMVAKKGRALKKAEAF